jgi:hypothetical protein
MVFVVVICLGLGGWHLLMTYGQWIEAEPAVVGQRIKIRGRYFHFFYAPENRRGWVKFEVLQDGKWAGYRRLEYGHDIEWGQFEFETEIKPPSLITTKPGNYTMTLTPHGGRPIHGKLVVRPAP